MKVAKPALSGSLVVDTFFVLSGFILTHVYAGKLTHPSQSSALDFWRHRFARIYPVYAAALVAFIALGHLLRNTDSPPIPPPALETSVIVRNALFLQSLPDGIVINPPAWSLPGEVAAYALFPLLVLAVVRVPRAWIAFALAAALAVIGATVIATTYTERFGYSLYELSWMRVCWAFPAGCLLARGWALCGRSESRWWDATATLGAVGVVVAVKLGDPSPGFYLPPARAAVPRHDRARLRRRRRVGPLAALGPPHRVGRQDLVLGLSDALPRRVRVPAGAGAAPRARGVDLREAGLAGAGDHGRRGAGCRVPPPDRGASTPSPVAATVQHGARVSAPASIPQLTGLRTVGAVWVVMLHALSLTIALWPEWSNVSRLALGGNLGVDLFFLLSGFIITHNYLADLGKGSVRRALHFWGLRLARLYPVFLLVLVAWAIFLIMQSPQEGGLFDGTLSPRNVVMNLLLLNHIPPASSISSTSWSVCLEFGAYLAFPFLAVLLVRIRSALLAAILTVAVLAGGVLLLIKLDVQSFEFFTYRVGWVRLAFEFLAGCLLYVTWSLSGRWREGRHWDIAFVAAGLGIVYACLHEDPTHPGFFPLAAVPLLALAVVSCAGSTGIVRGFFSAAPMMWMGRISYSLYMTHFFTLAIVTNGLREWWVRWPPSPFVREATPILIYAVIVIVAAGVYYLVEEPARRKLRRSVDRFDSGVGSAR